MDVKWLVVFQSMKSLVDESQWTIIRFIHMFGCIFRIPANIHHVRFLFFKFFGKLIGRDPVDGVGFFAGRFP
jgi:hypothetical protein